MIHRMMNVIGTVIVSCCLGCMPKPAHTPPSLTPPSTSRVVQKTGETIYTYHFTMVTPAQHNPLEFKDNGLQVRFMPRETVIELTVYNLGTEPLILLWDQTIYIDPQGLSHPIVHRNVNLADTSRRQTPTLILPQGVLSDSIAPIDYIYNSPSGWRQYPIFPRTKEALKLKGSTFSIVLPIKIQETVNSYTFQFQVTDVQGETLERP